MASKEIIEQRINENIGDIQLIQTEDLSGGCGSMFNLLIVSDKFKGLTRLKQHRLVHQALGEITKEIHALTLVSIDANAVGWFVLASATAPNLSLPAWQA
ncbi:hypothetical protein LPJ57_004544 [Coemansia sp. RSA 486]|nr:hypothetical protein LPJ57_004544 [Coemansia sp. RSA 486]